MVDFHSHVLPGVDDGAATVQEAVSLIRMLREQDVAELVLTPHFEPDRQSMADFLSRRAEAFASLREALDQADIHYVTDHSGKTDLHDRIGLHLGAEVICSQYLALTQNLEPLCIEGTRLLLLEMPFSSKWPSESWNILERLQINTITPVIAHVERYPSVLRHPAAMLKRLTDMGCVIQANADSFLDPVLRDLMMKWLDRGLIHVLGSDCHDTQKRPPRMKEALEAIRSGLGDPAAAERLDTVSAKLIAGRSLRGDHLFF